MPKPAKVSAAPGTILVAAATRSAGRRSGTPRGRRRRAGRKRRRWDLRGRAAPWRPARTRRGSTAWPPAGPRSSSARRAGRVPAAGRRSAGSERSRCRTALGIGGEPLVEPWVAGLVVADQRVEVAGRQRQVPHGRGAAAAVAGDDGGGGLARTGRVRG